MFGWRRKRNAEPHSVIDVHTEVEGPLRSRGVMEIRGLVTGDIEHEGTVVVAAEGCCQGRIRSTHLRISGEVQGDVVVAEVLQICKGGRLLGDAACGKLVIEAGGTFNGRNRMREDGEQLPVIPQPQPDSVREGYRMRSLVMEEKMPERKVPEPPPPVAPDETLTFSGYLRRREPVRPRSKEEGAPVGEEPSA